MSLAEDLIREQTLENTKSYARRVRMLALIYFVLNALSIVIIVTIAWRIRYFVTLAQRSNVETLVLAIIFALAAFYLISTFKGFIGAVRILWLNSFGMSGSSKESKERREGRKHTSIKTVKKGGESKSAYFHQAIFLEGKPGEAIKWSVGDSAGKLGDLVVDGVKATYYPIKDGMNNSIFEFLATQIERALQKRDLEAELQITQWSTIDEDQASAYYSMVQAFRNLEGQLGKGPIWPASEITQADMEKIQEDLNKLVPTLRNEAFLPDMEYEVEYTVPVLPEPLGFVQLTRNDNRADPVFTMGCAMFVMLSIMLVLTFFILLPPWIPSK